MSQFRDDLATFEALLRRTAAERYRLRLFVTGTTTRSATAVRNVRALCDRYLPGRYDLEIIDVCQQPELASQNQLLAAPTLIKDRPAPVRRLVGDLSDESRLLHGLNIVPLAS